MAYEKKEPQHDWRGSLTTDEAQETAELEAERATIEARLRVITSHLRLIRNRGVKRCSFKPGQRKRGEARPS